MTDETVSIRDSRGQISSESHKPFLFFVLAGLSGACGLAYEVIYVRLFSNYFGDSFIVSGIILCAVFWGIAFGAWQSSRFVKLLAHIELSIGVYAVFSVMIFSSWGFQIASLGSGTLANACKLVILLFIPAFLIGTCVPLFAHYVDFVSSLRSRVFTRVYALYNAGAFLSILAIEFFLFRQLGLASTACAIGAINLFIGIFLLRSGIARTMVRKIKKKHSLNNRVALALFLGSFASGIFQLYVLKISFSVFGPLHENFSIILASAILGIAIGSAVALRKPVSLRLALTWSVFAILIFLLTASIPVTFWSTVSGLGLPDYQELAMKILLLAGYPLAVFTIFGTFVPLAVQCHENSDSTVTGSLLAISSLGNGLGTLAMFIFLYRYLPLPQIGFLIFFLLVASLFVLLDRTKPYGNILGGAVLASAISFAIVQLWPHVELLLGYKALMRPEELAYRKENFENAVTYKAFDQNASVVSYRDNSRTLILNGYLSLTFNPLSKTVLHEMLVGATPLLFSKETKNALVFGLGSGISGGSTAQFYDQTKIVEINPAILNIPRHFSIENQNVTGRKNVEIALEDGISTLLKEKTDYDAIVNTVTSPQYYSASKLYTEDFYEIVISRLKNGGVYSSWFDLNIDREGISIMLNTLEKSFNHCRYFLLTRAYFNVVCSPNPLNFLSSATVLQRTESGGASLMRLFRGFGFENSLSDTMSALEIDFSPEFFERSSAKINTLDLPAIEFVVARASDEQMTAEALNRTITRNIAFQKKMSMGNSKWIETCTAISRMSEIRFEGCQSNP